MTDEEYDDQVRLLASALMSLKRERHNADALSGSAVADMAADVARPFWEALVVAYTGTKEDIARFVDA